MGLGVMAVALAQNPHWSFDPAQAAAFAVLFVCGLAIAYSFLVLLMSTAVWLVRNQNLMELWWLFTSLMRYPREIFQLGWAWPVGFFFTFVVPILLVVNVPARLMMKGLSLPFAGFTVVAAACLLYLSRRVFRRALGSYRSASS
jgi:ABC-2 type transport system permease protein